MKMVVCFIIASIVAMDSYAKVPPVKKPIPIICDGFIYEVKSGESGYIVKRNVVTGKMSGLVRYMWLYMKPKKA